MTDRDTVVLEDIDFAPSCGYPEGEQHPAEAVTACRSCRTTILLCNAHVQLLREQLERKPLPIRRITCTVCRAQGCTFDEVVEVVPL